jgi:hypothetical protein
MLGSPTQPGLANVVGGPIGVCAVVAENPYGYGSWAETNGDDGLATTLAPVD